ncbi:MAG: TOBE domain-containing protein [Bacteroidota bacterium]
MNTLSGTIIQTEQQGQLMLVHVQLGTHLLKSIVIETPTSAPYLAVNQKVQLLFKETEVIIAKGPEKAISLQNRLNCSIIGIDKGRLLSRLLLACGPDRLASVITSHAVDQLGLEIGDPVCAMIKTNELMLAPC